MHNDQVGTPRHRNHMEDSLDSNTPTTEIELKVDPPLSTDGRRRSRNTIRAASAWRKQLVVLMVDNSGSMRDFDKAKFATDAARELVLTCNTKSPEMACFDVAVFGYGDLISGADEHFLRPVNEINPEDIHFTGHGGGTKMKHALQFTIDLIKSYEAGYYQLHEEKNRVPPPLVFMLTDGYNGDGNPVPDAEQLKSMPLSIGVSPMLVTVGIEKGSGKDVPNVPMMKEMASETSHGVPLYFDVKELGMLGELLSTTSSSAAASTDDIFEVGRTVYPPWKDLPLPEPKRLPPPRPERPPGPKRLEGPEG